MAAVAAAAVAVIAAKLERSAASAAAAVPHLVLAACLVCQHLGVTLQRLQQGANEMKE
jgi:hypothetical protein